MLAFLGVDTDTWQAIGAIGSLGVLIVNVILVKSAIRSARAAEVGAEASRDLAAIARRDLEVSSSAVIKVLRDNNEPSVSLVPDERGIGGPQPGIYFSLRNDGPSPATFESAQIFLPGVSGSFQHPAPIDVLRTDDTTRFFVPIPPQSVTIAFRHGGTWKIQVPFQESGSDMSRTYTLDLKAKADGDGNTRFIVKREGSSLPKL